MNRQQRRAHAKQARRDNPDIDPGWKPNETDAHHARHLNALEGTPEAIKYFDRVQHTLTDYAYWFFLSTCWVKYAGHSDLDTWKRLFSSRRPNRSAIMKPSEHRALTALPDPIRCYRAHRPGERDWIAYTTDPWVVRRFAKERGVKAVSEYLIRKSVITAYFTRRSESEIICLNPNFPTYVRDWAVKGENLVKIISDRNVSDKVG